MPYFMIYKYLLYLHLGIVKPLTFFSDLMDAEQDSRLTILQDGKVYSCCALNAAQTTQ